MHCKEEKRGKEKGKSMKKRKNKKTKTKIAFPKRNIELANHN